MTSCPQCSADLPEAARFCPGCGAAQAEPACVACLATLPPSAKFCAECGAPQAPPSAGRQLTRRPVSSRRVTSVLFGDLVGFTTISESRDPEEMREILTLYFDGCRQVIDRYGGTVEKFIGDAVMAVWGVPTAHEDDAERAVRAGLELVTMAAEIGRDVDIPGFGMRIGIVTGEVAVTVGAENQGMVAGDAVNTAARVQSAAQPHQVWVDETTRVLTSSAITYLDVGSHQLKGKSDPMPLWSVHAVVAAVGGSQRADGLEAPLVGRDRELRLLKELFHSTEEAGRPHLLVLVGDAGVGKSRLAWEFEKYVDGLTSPVRWHSGRCAAYGTGLAFFALAEAIRPRLRSLLPDEDDDGGPDGLDGPDQSRLLELGLETYVDSEQERDWLRPRLEVLLGIGSVGTFQQQDLFSAWTVFLERVGGGLPVVLLIDDAHHTDVGLVSFIEHLLSAGTFPCFVALFARPGLLEAQPALATNRRATVSHLESLDEGEIASLLDGLVVGLPEDVRESMVERADGIPLFAVETVRSLIDRDLVVPRGGRYVLADPETLDLGSIGAPASLHALIAARLDALGPDARRLVERASVIGNSFSRDEVAELCADLGDVEALLSTLVHQQILGETTSRFSAEFGQFHFVQSAVRQVAYGTLSRRDRRAIHLAVARHTETVVEGAGDLAPVIAQHYLSAIGAMPDEPDVPALKERAIAQLERAAERARSLGALSDSAGHLLVALDLTAEPTVRARLDSQVAWDLVYAGEDERAVAHAESAVRAFDAAGDGVSAGLAVAAHGLALVGSGDNAGAVTLVAPRWEALLETPGADAALLALGKVLSLASTRTGEVRRDVLDRRIQIAERVGDRAHLADSLTALALHYSAAGAQETACTLMITAADIARRSHQPVELARCLSNLASEYNAFDVEKALAAAREGVEVADQSGVAMWQAYAGGNLMAALLVAGMWDELDEMLAQTSISHYGVEGLSAALRLARGEPYVVPWAGQPTPETDDPASEAWFVFAEAVQALGERRRADALALATRAVQTMFDLSGLVDDFVHTWPVAADLALALGDEPALARLLEMVDSAATRVRVPLGVLAHRRRLEGLRAAESDPAEAERLLRAAIADFEAWGSPHHRARTEGSLATVVDTLGRRDEAAVLRARAVATLTELGAAAYLVEVGVAAPAP